MRTAKIKYSLGMFPGARNPNQNAGSRNNKIRKNYLLYGAVAAIVVLASTAIMLAISLAKAQAVKIPAAITQQFQPPIYLPTKLPGNYRIDNETFRLQEDNTTVLIFNATDGKNGDLVFTEQAKPKDFDFDSFHNDNFDTPQTLTGTPYPSVWGKTINNRLSLSVITDDTWIMMTTSAPLSANDMRKIAENLRH